MIIDELIEKHEKKLMLKAEEIVHNKTQKIENKSEDYKKSLYNHLVQLEFEKMPKSNEYYDLIWLKKESKAYDCWEFVNKCVSDDNWELAKRTVNYNKRESEHKVEKRVWLIFGVLIGIFLSNLIQ